MEEAAGQVDPGAIPPQHRPYRERVTQVMEARSRDAGWDGQFQPWHEVVKRLADRPGMNRATAREGEHRRIWRRAGDQREILAKHHPQSGTERHAPALAEFRPADDEHVAVEVDIGAPQAAHLADAKAESIEQGKDGVVGRSAMPSPGLIGERGGDLQQAPRRRGVEQIRQAPGPHPSGRGLEGRLPKNLVQDEPVKEPADYTQELVITAATPPGVRGQEGRDDVGGEVVDPRDLLLHEEAIEQAELFVFRVEAAAERALVREKTRDAIGQGTLEAGPSRDPRMASPSPRATSRRASTATLE